MTIDDARENFMSDVYNTLDFLPTNNEANRIIDSFDRVTSGLNQQPCDNNWRFYYNHGYAQAKRDLSCEDCISRQAVIKLLSYDWANRPAHKAVESIKNLQSVTPKEKTGYWIDDANELDAQYGRHTYKCSECGKYAEYFISGTEVWWDRIKPNFCPNCGAEMIDPQESKELE